MAETQGASANAVATKKIRVDTGRPKITVLQIPVIAALAGLFGMRETTRRNQKRGLSMSGWLIAFCVALLVMLGLVLFFLIDISLKITGLRRRLAQIAEENSTRHEKQANIALGIESELKWIRRTLIP